MSTLRPERPPDLAPESVLTERSARVVAAAKLQRHVGRKRAGRFLAEGPNLVEAAARRGLVLEAFATSDAQARFADLVHGVPLHRVTEKAAKALSDTMTPVGLVAVCRLPEVRLGDTLSGSPRLALVAVDVSDPGNAGTLIRLADALGADVVVLSGNSVDPYNGKCLRSSAGSIFAVPVVAEPDVSAVVAAVREAGLAILATTLDGDVALPDVDLSSPTAWFLGSEAHGLPPDVAALADARVRIPMQGSAESLNVAAAAAICLYQSSLALGSGHM